VVQFRRTCEAVQFRHTCEAVHSTVRYGTVTRAVICDSARAGLGPKLSHNFMKFFVLISIDICNKNHCRVEAELLHRAYLIPAWAI